MDGSVRQDSQFEGDALSDAAQLVKVDERGTNMLWSSDSEGEPCSSVLNRLELRDEVGSKSKKDAVTIVQSNKD